MKIKKNMMEIMKKGALHNAKETALAKCAWFCYQPKVPTSLIKLKNK